MQWSTRDFIRVKDLSINACHVWWLIMKSCLFHSLKSTCLSFCETLKIFTFPHGCIECFLKVSCDQQEMCISKLLAGRSNFNNVVVIFHIWWLLDWRIEYALCPFLSLSLYALSLCVSLYPLVCTFVSIWWVQASGTEGRGRGQCHCQVLFDRECQQILTHHLGPVVQSVISLTSSLRVIS